MEELRRRSDGSIDCEFYVQQSRKRCAADLKEIGPVPKPFATSLKPKGWLSVCVTAFVLAAVHYGRRYLPRRLPPKRRTWPSASSADSAFKPPSRPHAVRVS